MDVPELPKNKDLTYLGLTTFRDKGTLFGIRRKDRRQHVYVLGKSGTGKSVLLSNMIIQNIQNGDGVCVVDPHGELVEGILQAIPPHRMRDVIYFNPADTDYHIGFNVLELVDAKYKHLVASGLMGIFTKIWANAWSARMEYILNNCILALLDTPGTTMLGIPRMLVDKDYRQKIISNLKDPVIKAFWVHEYEQWQDKFRNEAIAPIQNKVGQFLSTSIIRNVVGQSKSTIDIFDIMNQGKIFLVNVSKGRIGEDNSALLGGMIITKIQLAAMERVRIPEDSRKDFYLYVDEFQNFVTDAFAGILSEARKYRLNLTIAHQYTAQLVTENGSAVRDAVFGNVGTMIVFRVGADDADFLEKEFDPEFTPQDIVNLPNYRVYLRLMIDGVTSRPFSAKTLPPMITHTDPKVEEEVIRSSREYYCRTKEVIEKEINEWSGMMVGGDEAYNPSAEKFSAVCSSCGKETTVPFKPEPGRPVYCKECIAKIKSGEIKPVKGIPMAQVKYDESKFYQPLSDLGIEFESKYQAPSTPPPAMQNKPMSAPIAKPGIFSTIKKVFVPKPLTPVDVKPMSKFPISKPIENKEISAPAKFVKPISPAGMPPSPVRPAVAAATPSPSKWVNKPVRPAGENLALREILNKTLSESKILESKPVEPEVKIIEKLEPAPISLSELKPRIDPVLPIKDRSASSEDMDKLKDLISGKIETAFASIPKLEPTPVSILEPKQEVKPEPVPVPTLTPVYTPKSPEPDFIPAPTQPTQPIQQPPASTVREVPEDVLRKMLE